MEGDGSSPAAADDVADAEAAKGSHAGGAATIPPSASEPGEAEAAPVEGVVGGMAAAAAAAAASSAACLAAMRRSFLPTVSLSAVPACSCAMRN